MGVQASNLQTLKLHRKFLMNEDHETRITYLEKMRVSQTAILNLLVTSILQNDGPLRMKVADDLRLLQIRLEEQVHPDVLASISDLRSLLSARCSEDDLAASLRSHLRLVDPPA